MTKLLKRNQSKFYIPWFSCEIKKRKVTRIRNNTFTHARLKILLYVCFIEHDWTDCGSGGVGITLIPRESLLFDHHDRQQPDTISFFFSFFFIYSCKSSSEAICLRRKQVEQKERTKENEKYGDTIDNNLSCDLRAEAYRETREVAPPQGSHSPGNNREKKRDQRGCMRCMDGIKNNLHGVNNILHLTTILL